MKNGALVTCATKDDIASLQEWSERFPVEGRDASGIWHIYSVESLIAWRDAASEDPTVSACLHSSLDLSGTSWEPVSSEFQGFFDGGGHTIRNASCSLSLDSSDDSSYGVLFKIVDKAGVVSNVNMSGCTVTVEGTDTSRGCNTGIIAGTTRGSISGCTVSGCTVSSQAGYYSIIGAVVGNVAGSMSSCTAIGCTLYSRTLSYRSYCGGVAGQVGFDGQTADYCGGMTGCMACYCTITSVSDYSSSSSLSANITNVAGGVVGSAGNPVNGCISMFCTITASCTGGTYTCAGGVAGSSGISLNGCSAAVCHVTANGGAGYAFAGGCVGLHWAGIVSSCTVSGGNANYVNDDTTRTIIVASASSGSYMSAAGGIAGFMGGGIASLIGCSTSQYNTYYPLFRIRASHSTGPAYAGGIVGIVNNSSSALLSNSACIKAADTLTASGSSSYLGGIAGYANSSAIVSGNANLTKVSSDIGGG